MPFLTFANALPKIALAPILLLWFGVGESSKIVLAAIVVFFIVQVPTQAAVGLIDPDLNVVVDSLSTSEFQKFTKVVLPGIMAPVFGAFRLAPSSLCCRWCSPRSSRPNAGSDSG